MLDLPPVELSPNGRIHWRQRSAKKKEYRDACQIIALAAIPKGYIPPTRAKITYTLGIAPSKFTVNGKSRKIPDGRYRPRDYDNALASIKAAQDALTLAGAILGDDSKHLAMPDVKFDKSFGPALEVIIAPE